ncbi:hypothetical protein LCGC14_0351170 [marine sediment metagenome]|uniref:Uncharacterized protein n=1 Tax=marine sediment metagenome TaxID=412755 RepID=A0A0F9WII6_9ZZZZ
MGKAIAGNPDWISNSTMIMERVVAAVSSGVAEVQKINSGGSATQLEYIENIESVFGTLVPASGTSSSAQGADPAWSKIGSDGSSAQITWNGATSVTAHLMVFGT